MNSRLDNLTGHRGSLAEEPPDHDEFNGLKRSGLARLHDAANTDLSLGSRFDLAYNAAHAPRLYRAHLGHEQLTASVYILREVRYKAPLGEF